MKDNSLLIEEYLPIEAIGKEASREKSIRKGHISTLHLWWARRPLVACRAAVYGALVPASYFLSYDNQKTDHDKVAEFLKELCKYPGSTHVLNEARKHILEAHAERLQKQSAAATDGQVSRPKVLDSFAGGGAIPLEALRLGCDAYALDLNPVAHIIELCTLVYPQKYGKPDPNAFGMTGQPNREGKTTWGGLAEEVRYWGKWVIQKAKAATGDLYPLIPDPEAKGTLWTKPQSLFEEPSPTSAEKSLEDSIPEGYLVPIAYLWTRTVRCKNPSCGRTVPLVRQTWLIRKEGRYIALKMIVPKEGKRVLFEVVESTTKEGLGFDPAEHCKSGNATCPFCGTVADSEYVKEEGKAGRLSQHQMMAIVCTKPGEPGKVYCSADDYPELQPDEQSILKRIDVLCKQTGLTIPNELMDTKDPATIAGRGFGIQKWSELFTPRQLLCLLTFAAAVREAQLEMTKAGLNAEQARAVGTYLGILVNRLADYNSAFCRWQPTKGTLANTFGRQAIPMVWDFGELAPFGDKSGSPEGALKWIVNVIEAQSDIDRPATVIRGSATALPWPDAFFDAVITDPPYYDNVQYAALSDFFYVWFKRTIGHLYPEHFSTELSPKKNEIVASPHRYKSKAEAKQAYEQAMAKALAEANRVLKPGSPLVVVYAHKTTFGWATLVDALRKSGFAVTEAWPFDTEMKARLVAMETASLSSSIFIVSHKREETKTGSYEDEVRPELEQIVRERVVLLWKMGIAGADLIIAAVGAGLRAYTRFARIEYANGEEVPAEKFLAEVEGVVLETLLEKLFGMSTKGVASIDGPTRFYVLWRYAYKTAEVDAGEAIVFTYGQGVELDGPKGLSSGRYGLVEKKKNKYRLRDFTERGESDKLGLASETEPNVPLIDKLHRMLWLMENQPRKLDEFLNEVKPDLDRLRAVAQVLVGQELSSDTENEQKAASTTDKETTALKKLLTIWRTVTAAQQQLPLFKTSAGENK
ncbi:MAG: DUF1156 domain-containing protein [Acidobacteriota bacterium]|nr:DUF1156 domain-containing protein [Acidobacteriota bacterium]MDW8413515.1 DUF1156 domain-containing protein [Acidobacteriota bacterium]